MVCASHLYVAGQTSSERAPAGTHLVMVLVRQRAFPTCDAEPQTAPLARHFDLQLEVCAQSKTWEEARQLITPYKLQKKTFETASSYSERHPGDCQLLGRGVSRGRGCLGIVKRLLLSGDTHVWSCRVLECHSLTRQGFALWQLASVVLTKRRCRLVFSCSRLRLPPSLRASAKTFAVEWDINSVKHTSGSLSSPASSSDLDWLQTLGW